MEHRRLTMIDSFFLVREFLKGDSKFLPFPTGFSSPKMLETATTTFVNGISEPGHRSPKAALRVDQQGAR